VGLPAPPEGSKERFDQAFPADFISEAIDQTRGWFYSLLMISTLVFDEETQQRMGLSRMRDYPHPYKTCVVLGHVCDREGKKESKSKGNYTPPEVILERVRMEFAAVPAEGEGPRTKPGVAFIAREDYEGLDLTGESRRCCSTARREARRVAMELRPTKALPRRVVGLDPRRPRAARPHRREQGPRRCRQRRAPPPAGASASGSRTRAPAPGADAFRWFFYASSPPWTNTRHSLTNVRGTQKEFLVKLRNVYSFFVIYANIDGFSPAGKPRPSGLDPVGSSRKARATAGRSERAELDRWMLSELALTTKEVTAWLDDYLLYDAAQRLVDFVDALSNWYVRRSREPLLVRHRREPPRAAGQARRVLHAVRVPGHRAGSSRPSCRSSPRRSVAEPGACPLARHAGRERAPGVATRRPTMAAIDAGLAREMRAVRELVSPRPPGAHREQAARCASPSPAPTSWSRQGAVADALARTCRSIAEELNVHEVCSSARPGGLGGEVRAEAKFPRPRPEARQEGAARQGRCSAKADAGALRAELATEGACSSTRGREGELGPEEIEVAVEAKPASRRPAARWA
jgi:isoleucyl-tRNA synthetase